ncbi:hypothetical protein MK079_02720, partial [Candidatus Gracilibacteria bacterium]|nr:hypothetical protein [Candidatus Gracilibacteria bacterium]
APLLENGDTNTYVLDMGRHQRTPAADFYHFDDQNNLIKRIETKGKIFSQPLCITDDIICFSSNDGYIYFYNYLDQNIVYRILHGEKIQVTPLYDDGFLYIIDFVGGVYKYFLRPYLEKTS